MYRALTTLTVAALCQTGCGIKTEIVARKYVRSELILAAQGGTLTVTAADVANCELPGEFMPCATLAGTQIVIPPGALVADTVITVGPGAGSIAPAGAQTGGALVVVGPDDTMFNHPATVRLPFTLPSGAQIDQLVVDALESNGEGSQIANSELTIDGGLVSFAATHFTQFEPDIIHLMTNDGGPGDGGDGGPVIDAGCPDGFTLCPPPDGGTDGDICVDTSSDDQNCGLCGKVCPPGAICFNQGTPGGTCICDTSAADGGDLLYCNDFCVHSDTDPLNCGYCTNKCDTDECIGGDCLCQPDAGIVRCAPHQCSILNADKFNCGACGNDCTLGGTLNLPDIVCVGGQCLCADGQNICFEAATFPALSCISTTSDPTNCGGCGLSDAGPLPDGGSPPGPHVCSGVTTNCENGSCVCPTDHPLFCAAGSWRTDAGTGGVTDLCVNDSSDRFNCGSCGNDCDIRYAGGALCQYALCACQPTNGICVSADDPAEPSCDCSGFHDGGSPFISCDAGIQVTYSKDIYPLLSASTVSIQSWGVLIGCAVSGCHDTSAAAGLGFTDPDASYQQLMNTPSQICAGQLLTIPGDGNDSLLTQLLENNFQCPMPAGGTASPMPIDDGGVYHPLSPCLRAQVREWIDQGMAY